MRSDIRSGGGAVELNFQQNDYIIRLADTYLLEAEALGGTGARAQALLDAVRARVGLPSVPVSIDAIKTERRLELAGEGHRFFDLQRWDSLYGGPAGNGFMAGILNAYIAHETGSTIGSELISAQFTPGRNELYPIPQSQLTTGGKIKQNPGY